LFWLQPTAKVLVGIFGLASMMMVTLFDPSGKTKEENIRIRNNVLLTIFLGGLISYGLYGAYSNEIAMCRAEEKIVKVPVSQEDVVVEFLGLEKNRVTFMCFDDEWSKGEARWYYLNLTVYVDKNPDIWSEGAKRYVLSNVNIYYDPMEMLAMEKEIGLNEYGNICTPLLPYLRFNETVYVDGTFIYSKTTYCNPQEEYEHSREKVRWDEHTYGGKISRELHPSFWMNGCDREWI